VFEQEYVETRNGAKRSKRFTLAFRTVSVAQMTRRLEIAGLTVRATLGSYGGDPWTKESDTWIVIAEKA
jgi:hypothetical protein